MSKSGIRRKHAADATQLRRISHPASPTYKEGPPGRANGRTTYNAHKERYEGPPNSLPEEDEDEGHQRGVGRTPIRPNLPCLPSRCTSRKSHLITFHMCVGGKPTSRATNRASPPPPLKTHTHTSFHSLQEGSPLSCSLS